MRNVMQSIPAYICLTRLACTINYGTIARQHKAWRIAGLVMIYAIVS